ncbi:6-aminohexanoate-cyclic-dimer hydrolase [Mycobacterium basiliense]|uniref:amidase n=1 Tax=Mycobacterium basiliense TaxID=2094119 RepID=A0A447GJQ8_9MYCO|nr:amidase [Mycobacterium basiliense]VDM90740.1 6-aminohexanoate-cyclic-dimer hydrolase [Mycobacterium basiliense]
MQLDEYLSLDATALAELIERKQVTPAEVLALARQQADAVNPRLNAIISRLDEVADRRAADPKLQGPFAGVPFLIKDLDQEYRGFATSCGSRSLATDVAQRHALVTQRFLDAGLVIFGKTNTPEFGAKGVTESEYWGPARNPWNLQRTPGGSSGGSGAAVAAGIVPAAGANDGGGSIRIPAGCNGLVGLKLSRGLSPYGPQTGEPMFGMVAQGVVSRTVRDSAALLDAIIGPNPRAAYRVALPDRPFTAHITDRPGTLRIGYSTSSAITAHPHREAIAAVQQAAQLLSDLGHQVEEVEPPYDDAALARDFLTIWFAQLHRQVADIKKRTGARDNDFEADTLAMCELARSTGVLAPMQALEHINNYIQSLTTFHETHDFFLTPTLATPPLPIGATTTSHRLQSVARVMSRLRAGKVLALSGIMDELIQESLGWVPYTQLANLTGRPAINVPLHWTADRLPLGVQFVGRLGADGDLLQLAAQLEEAQPWAHRHPAAAATLD